MTTPLPGTPAIIRLYRQRAMQRHLLFVSEDARPEDRRSPLLTRRRNGIVEVKNETGLQDVVLPASFHAKLTILAKRCGFSVKNLAAELGVSKGAVQHWLTGRRYPSRKMLKKIANLFGVTVGKLCD